MYISLNYKKYLNFSFHNFINFMREYKIKNEYSNLKKKNQEVNALLYKKI